MLIFTCVIIFLALVNILVYYLRKHVEEEDYGDRKFLLPSPPDPQCRRFSLAQIKSATQNFNEALVIGKGGFGKVYKGIIDSGANTVAIKRLDFGSNQGAMEFWTEVEMLSKFRHSHVVSLIGYCNEHHEMIIVYEYMPSGSLEDNLHKLGRSNCQNRNSIAWVQRLKICLGAARGLDYLHTGTSTEHRVIHRDVKSSNILLDENMEAKISDFGLSKIGPANQPCTNIYTHVKGTFGYLDPEYFLTHRLTKKSDVYAFGVVLFEVLCGRPAVDTRLDNEEMGFAGWAKRCVKEGKIGQFIDPSLNGSILSNCLDVFSKIACQCLQNSSKRRPTMGYVVSKLESAIAMQEMPDISLLEDETARPLGTYGNQKIADSGCAWSHARPAKKRTFIRMVQAFFSSKSHSTTETEALDGLESFQFDFGVVRTATDNFASANIIGYGGFGPVFKGTLQNGQAIAIKMLSASSTQGVSEFKNEVILLQKVRHKNLIRLFGFCVKGKQKLLIYELQHRSLLIYELQHRSLRNFLSDSFKCSNLNWDYRYKIIRGVARGIFYLHEESPYQIIHRDIHCGTIMLDAELNPKISDFGFAKLQKKHVSEGISDVIMGTSGYLAPEYAMHGHFSVKSDVFGFGVLLLEVIKGRKIHIVGGKKNYESSLDNAWRNWMEGTPLNYTDLKLRADRNDGAEVVRCIQIGLLCAEENAIDRPTMGSVLLMLRSQSTSLPEPSTPAYFNQDSNTIFDDSIYDAETDVEFDDKFMD